MQAITRLSFIGSFDMIRTTLTAAAIPIAALAAPAQADSTKAYCTLAWHDETVQKLHMAMPRIEGPCDFSQYQGNAYVDDFNYYKFAFPSAEQGKTRPMNVTTEKRESPSYEKADTP